uniref:Uncharacterized protein n=1 Tax=Anguilla anguilla TaxID=7936 RepID=A0A0E9VKL8_ANGAN
MMGHIALFGCITVGAVGGW